MTYTPPTVKHVPLRPARDSVVGEVVFLKLWQQYATSKPEEWEAIFNTNGPVRQRAASVAASFVVYMGCNVGASFTQKAEMAWQSGAYACKEHAYVAQWAIDNQRRYGINNNLRSIEYILSRDYPISTDRGVTMGGVLWENVPAITMEDIDVIESMVRWWSTATADPMRQHAAALVEAARIEERMYHNFGPSERGRLS